MDHKVSKDMISSGMIPSGEKTQADLGRTQYGSVPSPSSLMDAYKSMYEHHKKDADGNTIPHEGEELTEMDRNMGGLGLASKIIGSGINALQKVSNLGAKTAVGLGGVGVGVKGGKLMYDAYKDAKKNKKVNKNKTQTNSHELEGDQLDEINAGYSTDPGLAATPKPKVSNLTRQGKERTPAQMAAAKRIASGKTIADVKAANTSSMRSSARARNVDFRAERRPAPKPMASNFSGGVSGKGKATDDFSSQYKSTAGTSTNIKTKRPMGRSAAKRRNMMNDVDLFDIIKGRLIDEFYLEEKEALNLMINLSEAEIDEMLGGVKGDGYIGHPRLGIKNPISPPKKETKKTNGGSGLTNKLGNRATEIEKMIKGM